MRLFKVMIMMNDAVNLFLVSLCVTVAPTFAQRSNHGLHLMIRDLLQSNDGFIPFNCCDDETDLPTRAPESSVDIDPSTERLHQVLIALGLPDSNDVSSFLEKFGDSHCDWTWVACNEDEHATKIDISGLKLSGTIHPGIAEINTLEDVLLDDNNLYGTVPLEMTDLYKLSKFIVDNNPDLGGSPDFLCDIETFSFTHTQIPYYTCAPTLRQVMMGLGVSENEMENKRHCDWPGVDCSSTNMNNVIGISLSFSDLSGTIDPVIGEIDTLEKIQLQNNQLRGTIPDEMQHMQSLSMFIVNDNPDLSGSPSFLCDLEVFLFINTKIPRYLCTSNLEKVLIGLGVSEAELVDELHCTWRGITCHSGTTVVKSINLSNSGLVGTIDPLIGELDGLEEIQLQYNKLQGTIPDEMQHMQSLSMFIVDDNPDLSGSPDFLCDINVFSYTNTKIPRNLCTSSHLKKVMIGLGVSEDYLVDELYCNWQGITCRSGTTDVQFIYLRQSNLVGTIDPAIGELITLEEFSIHVNYITGTLPSQIGDLDNLRILQVHYNDITGTLPSQIGRLSELEELKIYDNSLSGTLPSSIGNLTKLEIFYFRYNRFTGTIPLEWQNMESLREINLSGNELTGTILTELCNLPDMSFLQLARNEFTGSIPSELGLCNKVWEISLVGNGHTGTIPSELGNMVAMERFMVYENGLTGIIPSEFGNMVAMERFEVYKNDLTGTIPQELSNMASLEWFDVSNNDLHGSIPPDMGELPLDVVRVVSNEHLSGSPDFLCGIQQFDFWNTDIPDDLCD